MQSSDERMDIFIDSLEKGNGEFLDALEISARQRNVPVIKKPVQGLLRVLINMKHPENILEIGTAVGFSAILMALCTGPQVKITTIEDYDIRADEAEENIKKAGLSDRIELIRGDAVKILPTLNTGYDFIFMDAAKAQYINYLPEAIRLLNKGGILVADNCLQDGDILESKFIVERRDRTIHKRMREFLTAIEDNPELETALLPMADGIVIAVKKE